MNPEEPLTPPPSYNEAIALAEPREPVFRVHSEPTAPSAPFFEDQANQNLPEPIPSTSTTSTSTTNYIDRINEPRLTPAARRMIDDYNASRDPTYQRQFTDKNDVQKINQTVPVTRQPAFRRSDSHRFVINSISNVQQADIVHVERNQHRNDDEKLEACCACCLMTAYCCKFFLDVFSAFAR